MIDETEGIRREMVSSINSDPLEREQLETLHGQVWNTEQLTRDFDVIGFMAPFVMVRRKLDRTKGTLMFQHSPRFYFDFKGES